MNPCENKLSQQIKNRKKQKSAKTIIVATI